MCLRATAVHISPPMRLFGTRLYVRMRMSYSAHARKNLAKFLFF